MTRAQRRMAGIRRRLASTTGERERTLLVLAHEALRHQEQAREQARAAATAAVPQPLFAPPPPCEYRTLVERIKQIIGRTVPANANLLVVSRGDESLLHLHHKNAGHFPQGKNGIYAGHHPADSAAAIAHLEHCRDAGAEFLVLPATAYWWLHYYAGLALHLLTRHSLRHNDEHCLIFDLTPLTAQRQGASIQ